jgi:hypothetical protein
MNAHKDLKPLEGLTLSADDGSSIDLVQTVSEQRATVLLPYRGTW